jgi:molecular chaperone DnaK
MVREAEMHAQEDRQRKEEIEERNRADSVAYQAERTLRDVGEKISASTRADVEAKIQSVRDALASNDMQRVRSATSELESTLQRVGQEIYSQAGSAASPQGPSSGSDSNTFEGEYREV